jgi:hypothetical protein
VAGILIPLPRKRKDNRIVFGSLIQGMAT